jgi:hypothetical protein
VYFGTIVRMHHSLFLYVVNWCTLAHFQSSFEQVFCNVFLCVSPVEFTRINYIFSIFTSKLQIKSCFTLIFNLKHKKQLTKNITMYVKLKI